MVELTGKLFTFSFLLSPNIYKFSVQTHTFYKDIYIFEHESFYDVLSLHINEVTFYSVHRHNFGMLGCFKFLDYKKPMHVLIKKNLLYRYIPS